MTGKLNMLSAWERDVLEELTTVSKDLDNLLSRRDHLQAKLDLVLVLLSLEPRAESQAAFPPEDCPYLPLFAPTGAHPLPSTSERKSKAVATILAERGEPIHVREIRAAMTARGLPIPGRGTDANIIVHLVRMPDLFVRTSRGTYGLAQLKRPAAKKPPDRATKSTPMPAPGD